MKESTRILSYQTFLSRNGSRRKPSPIRALYPLMKIPGIVCDIPLFCFPCFLSRSVLVAGCQIQAHFQLIISLFLSG